MPDTEQKCNQGALPAPSLPEQQSLAGVGVCKGCLIFSDWYSMVDVLWWLSGMGRGWGGVGVGTEGRGSPPVPPMLSCRNGTQTQAYQNSEPRITLRSVTPQGSVSGGQRGDKSGNSDQDQFLGCLLCQLSCLNTWPGLWCGLCSEDRKSCNPQERPGEGQRHCGPSCGIRGCSGSQWTPRQKHLQLGF